MADVKGCDGFRREVVCRFLRHFVEEEFPLGVFAVCHCPGIIHGPYDVESCGHKVPVISASVG